MSRLCPYSSLDKVIGALFNISERPHSFIDDDMHLLTALAEMAGNAIHRMRLHEQTQREVEVFGKLYATAHNLAGQSTFQ